MTRTNQQNKSMLFILVCLDDLFNTQCRGDSAVAYHNWLRLHELERMNTCLNDNSHFIHQWRALCQSQS